MIQETADFLYDMLFSMKRFEAEEKTCRMTVMKAFRVTNEYVQRCDEARMPVILPHLIRMFSAITESSSRYPGIRYDLGLLMGRNTNSHLRLMTRYYACIALDFWTKILKMTDTGRTQPQLFPQKECVVGILYMMKLGHNVRTGRTNNDGSIQEAHVIIPYDSFLERVLPEANNLCNYGVNHHNFTLAKNAMSSAINAAFCTEGVLPTALRMQLDCGLSAVKSQPVSGTAPSSPHNTNSPRAPPPSSPRGLPQARAIPPDEAFVGYDTARSSDLKSRVQEYARRCSVYKVKQKATCGSSTS
jgi:hypothetical protein